MEIPVIYIFTHDSIGVGEDGPTHQPIEQLASLRAIPGLIMLRPGDANEVVEAWRVIMQLQHEPAVAGADAPGACRPRPHEVRAGQRAWRKGAYVLADAEGGSPRCSCSAPAARCRCASRRYEQLKAEGVRARVVSMPSWELFEQQDQAYRDSVLPPSVTARVSVEQAAHVRLGALRGADAATIIGMQTFGASAPLKELQKKFGFTVDNVVEAARAQLALAER